MSKVPLACLKERARGAGRGQSASEVEAVGDESPAGVLAALEQALGELR